MKLFRFMSKDEFDKLINGEILENNKKHEGYTSSVGFCFMKVKDNEPEYAYEFLSGIVSDDVCVVFETKKRLTKSYGIYADPYGKFFDTTTEDEYCIQEYSLNDFKIVEMAIPKIDWTWYTDIKKVKSKLDRIRKQEEKEEQECKLKDKLNNDFKNNQTLKLLEFTERIKEKHELEIKIDNKFYKIPCGIIEMGSVPSSFLGVQLGKQSVYINFETWFD